MPRIDVPFKVDKQIIIQTPPVKIAAGGKNYFYAVFDLCDTWNDVPAEKAVFIRDDIQKVMSLSEGANDCLECRVPWEVMQEPGFFRVGIFGGDTLPTNTTHVKVIEGCVQEGDEPLPPTPDWFSEIDKELSEINNKLDTSVFLVSVHDNLTSIIPKDGDIYVVKYHDMPAYDENKEPIITDTVRYRMKIGDGVTNLEDLPFVSQFQGGEGEGSMVQIDPTYDNGDDRYYSPCETPGQLAIAFGKYNKVLGKVSMAVGYYNLVEAARAFAAGYGNHIGVDAISAFIAGFCNIVLNKYQTSFGMYNDPNDPDALFTIGVGTSEENRKNGFTVCKKGIIKINGEPINDITVLLDHLEDIIKTTSLADETDSILDLTDNFKSLKSDISVPKSLYMDGFGKIKVTDMPYTLTETICKFYRYGHSDVASQYPSNYTEFPKENSGSDRIWAWLGDTASKSSSGGSFEGFTTYKGTPTLITYMKTSNEWTAFKIKITKSGNYYISGKFYNNIPSLSYGVIETYVLPMTEERAIEFHPDNVETYGVIENAGDTSHPNQRIRTGFKTFNELTSISGESPVGEAIDLSNDTEGFIVEKIGEVNLEEGEYLLLFHPLKGMTSMMLSELYLDNVEVSGVNIIKVGNTVLTEEQLKKLLKLI